MLLVPVLGKQRQAGLWEFKANVVYRVRARTARATQRNHASKNTKKRKKKEIILSDTSRFVSR